MKKYFIFFVLIFLFFGLNLWAFPPSAPPPTPGVANGVASLDANSKVVQDPANATATPTAGKIAIYDAGGKLDSAISAAFGSTAGIVTPASPPEFGSTTTGRIGVPGQIGFGVGVCPVANLPSGFTPMPGYAQPSSPNYGNYQYTDGSIMVFVPKFYYRMHTWATNQITAATKANPCQITQVAHGYVDGDKIFICNVGGMTNINNLVFTVTRIDDDNYTIGVDSSSYGAFTSGGDSTKGFGTGFDFNRTLVTYGKNSIAIRGTETYATEALANADGYALHRAFYDGGAEQVGFFVDKYKCSKNASGTGYIASSIPNAKPLSSASTHNPFSDLTGGENYYYSAIDLAHRRDGTNGNVNASSRFFCKSQFIQSALAMLSLAHGQYSQTDTYCAWYNATYNYPKGNNSNLKDADDATVMYASDGYGNSSITGSGVAFSKTTHNGQDCGVADLNGGVYEISIGVTCVATSPAIEAWSRAAASEITITGHDLANGDFIQINAVAQADWVNAKDKIWQITKTGDDTFTIAFDSSGFGTAYDAGTDPGTITKGAFYVAKKATAMKTFTNGKTGATDHWGATGVAAMMDPFAPPFKTGYAYAMRMGSGTNQVLSPATSGAGWVLTGLGSPVSGSGVDTAGTNLFGKDYSYQYISNELCLLSSGTWYDGSAAGVWCVHWYHSRSSSNGTVGFRAACYPD